MLKTIKKIYREGENWELSKCLWRMGVGLFLFAFFSLPSKSSDTSHTATSSGVYFVQDPTTPHIKPPPEIFYQVLLSGTGNFTLRHKIIETSVLFQRQAMPIDKIADLKVLATNDLKNIATLLNSMGYYDATLDYKISLKARPIIINLIVEPGEPYTIGSFQLKSTQTERLEMDALQATLETVTGVHKGDVASDELIQHAIKSMFLKLATTGCPFAKITAKNAVIDRTSRQMLVSITMDPGPAMKFGKVLIQKGAGVDKKFVLQRLRWKEGEVYNQDLVLQTVQDLNNTGLFSFVKIIHEPNPPKNGKLNMLIEIEAGEGNPWDGGIKYSTTLGVGGMIKWTGKNLFGKGDNLDISGIVGQFSRGLDIAHVVPDFLWVNTDLTTQIKALSVTMPAYNKMGTWISSTFTTPIYEKYKGFIGVAFEVATVKPPKSGTDNSYSMLSIPMGVKIDKTDDSIKPTEGWRGKLDLVTYMDLGPTKLFLQGNLQQEFYFPITSDKRLTLMGWYDIGATPDSLKRVLPIDKYFYSGGEGSIRGYGAQMAGPLSANGTPLGGRSLIEFGAELTYYFTEQLAGVGFVDAGGASPRLWPNISNKLFVGVGSGVRYITPIGTLKVDVGVPINRRPQDDKAQLYVSMGQPF